MKIIISISLHHFDDISKSLESFHSRLSVRFRSLFKSRWQLFFFWPDSVCLYSVWVCSLWSTAHIGLLFILSCMCFRLPLRTVIPTMLCKPSALTTTMCWPHWPGSWLPLAALFFPTYVLLFHSLRPHLPQVTTPDGGRECRPKAWWLISFCVLHLLHLLLFY